MLKLLFISCWRFSSSLGVNKQQTQILEILPHNLITSLLINLIGQFHNMMVVLQQVVCKWLSYNSSPILYVRKAIMLRKDFVDFVNEELRESS